MKREIYRWKASLTESRRIDDPHAAVAILRPLRNAGVRVALDDFGYVKAREDCVTNIPGVFAAGDLRTKPMKQIVTAVADGANAINSARNYLTKKE